MYTERDTQKNNAVNFVKSQTKIIIYSISNFIVTTKRENDVTTTVKTLKTKL